MEDLEDEKMEVKEVEAKDFVEAGHVVKQCWYRFDQSFENENEQNSAATLPPPPSSSFHQLGAIHHLTFDGNNMIEASGYDGSEQVYTGNDQGVSGSGASRIP
ncbi:hypothetical protein PIB30_054957 [Stylosanthes scabra]|uniref:Uncharacterized protein n=1 Tax=Stylosanthes scabra TaxID=79078 RepID=A0ABU6RJA2_9FABA|nr:hypothetical protein [Stylosanthes scabra]